MSLSVPTKQITRSFHQEDDTVFLAGQIRLLKRKSHTVLLRIYGQGALVNVAWEPNNKTGIFLSYLLLYLSIFVPFLHRVLLYLYSQKKL